MPLSPLMVVCMRAAYSAHPPSFASASTAGADQPPAPAATRTDSLSLDSGDSKGDSKQGRSRTMRPLVPFWRAMLDDPKWSDVTIVVDGTPLCLAAHFGLRGWLRDVVRAVLRCPALAVLDVSHVRVRVGKRIRALKAVLTRSPYFEAMFERFAEGKSVRLLVSCVLARARSCVRLCYAALRGQVSLCFLQPRPQL